MPEATEARPETILSAIRQGSETRRDIVAATGLPVATVTYWLRHLVMRRTVTASGYARGRRYQCVAPHSAPQDDPEPEPEPTPEAIAPPAVPSHPAPAGIRFDRRPARAPAATEAERAQALAAYEAGGGEVTVCQPGQAAGLSALETTLGVSAPPPRPDDGAGWRRRARR
ncbi:hypothetical protein F1188_19365 [Roseospira marina]|uniref:Uncharacterized protein n=2 Tax=Roseospira marina TaxID=140057 RepID=A0A5M6I680_9PROT|nr:hypothetical protein F1188_19365 [Roseospira marina]